MKTTTMTNRPVAPNDAPELQEVLTRCVDSRNGYHQAAELIENEAFISGFRQIAARRALVIDRLKSAIASQGNTPSTEGSTEAKLHRWWIELRAGMSDDDLSAIVSEGLRGEQELERTIESACSDPQVLAEHKPLLASVREDVRSTVAELDALVKAL